MYAEIKDMKLPAGGLAADFQKNIRFYAAQFLQIAPEKIKSVLIAKRSLDSRGRELQFIYTLYVELEKSVAEACRLRCLDDREAETFLTAPLELPQNPRLKNPVVVGTGPAGIFAALVLAMAGTEPVIIDRGSPIAERYEKYREFLKTRELSESDNLLIGEGGAGAFSDGKLYTGTRSDFSGFVLKNMIDCGAPEEIRYLKRPHVGSDRLRVMTSKLREKVTSLGGKFLFHCNVSDLLIKDGACKGVILENGETIESPAVFIAPGLGGRELVKTLIRRGAEAELKNFQIGCRIEHPQSFIDKIMYHTAKRPACLGAAEYHLLAKCVHDPSLNVSSFCMCPGGEVLNATAWRGHSCSNGMSDYARSGEFANSCLIMTLNAAVFGSVSSVYEYIDQIETACFALGGGDYTLPAQDAAAFLRGENGLKNSRSAAAFPLRPGRLDSIMLPQQKKALCNALKYFDRNYPDFIRNGKFIGIESCVSSPLRFRRDPETLESTIPGLYLGGEGAGCAGGIMSAACDGIGNAFAMMRKK